MTNSNRYPKKTCTKCGAIKPSFEFQKSKRTKDGFTTQCKDCLNHRKSAVNKKDKSQKESLRFAVKELVRNHRVEFDRLRKAHLQRLSR